MEGNDRECFSGTRKRNEQVSDEYRKKKKNSGQSLRQIWKFQELEMHRKFQSNQKQQLKFGSVKLTLTRRIDNNTIKCKQPTT